MPQRIPTDESSEEHANEKLIDSQSKKEMESFIRAHLRMTTRETGFQKALRTVPPARS